MTVTNKDIYELLGEIRESQKGVIRKMDEIVLTHKEHVIEDIKQFKELNENLAGMNKYYGYVGTVAGFIGGLVGFCMDYFINRKT